jgi:hypothetical protein
LVVDLEKQVPAVPKIALTSYYIASSILLSGAEQLYVSKCPLARFPTPDSQYLSMTAISPADSEEGRDIKEAQTAASLECDDSFTNPTGINEKALLRKLDLKLLPPLVVLYLLSFLDRSNGG